MSEVKSKHNQYDKNQKEIANKVYEIVKNILTYRLYLNKISELINKSDTRMLCPLYYSLWQSIIVETDKIISRQRKKEKSYFDLLVIKKEHKKEFSEKYDQLFKNIKFLRNNCFAHDPKENLEQKEFKKRRIDGIDDFLKDLMSFCEEEYNVVRIRNFHNEYIYFERWCDINENIITSIESLKEVL